MLEFCDAEVLRFIKFSLYETVYITQTNIIEAFWYCTIDHGKDLDSYSFLKLFQKLDEPLDSLPVVVEAFLNEPLAFPTYPVSFQEILNSSKLVETVDCLKQQKLKFNELRNIAYFVGNLTKFPNSSITNESISFLEHTIKVQNALKTVKTKMMYATGNRTKRDASNSSTNPVLTLKNPRLHSENMGICSLALWNLVKVLELKTPLLKIGEFNEKVKTSMTGYPGLTNYIHAKGLIQDFLDQAEGIEKEAKQLKDTDPLKMATVFAKMANLKGVPGDR
ncbi:Protein CBG26178 [Caenorhabditis briggsae]|uniref:Protein CBG26178 n=1 Tax=Caenorhabditis briggsae TaxID=6238 RepID=B6ILB4_CAEBR|nr:Protein CBG26178 [Caenorhabditis briggsae]CAS00694.1 Protein CBG26178 [Caenorhabditis briggsae]